MKCILACVDSSSMESVVVKTASALAMAHGVRIYLVHVDTIRAACDSHGLHQNDPESKQWRRAWWELQGLQRHLELQDIDVVCVLPDERNSVGIAKAIDVLGVDLVLMPESVEPVAELLASAH